MITLTELNALPAPEFAACLGAIFEHSPWVAERAAAGRPFASRRHLLEAMCAAVDAASPAEQLMLIRAHPRLRRSAPAREELTAASSREQRGAGLDACTPAEATRLDELNEAYVAKFAMPFILAVRGHTPQSIIAAFERRLNDSQAGEQRTALREIGMIAGYRLADTVAETQANYADLSKRYVNVADQRLGAVALSATDEFFAPVARMLAAAEPEWRAGVYDEHGKWMDGWETRRRRTGGNDHCILRLAGPCTLTLLDLDTRYFTGNYPPFASLEAARVAGDPDEQTPWTEILPRSPLEGNQHNFFALPPAGVWTHLKLNIYPDGGIARLRAYGTLQPDWKRSNAGGPVDLVSALNGGRALACNDEHYGAMGNLLLPGRGASMADGWETRRRREPGFDWVILALGSIGRIQCVEIDTAHFKGNYPHQVSIHAARVRDTEDLYAQSLHWPVLLEPELLGADRVVQFREQLHDLGCVSHVRVNIHPDGGLSRVRLLGLPERGGT
jgi:allantoicase